MSQAEIAGGFPTPSNSLPSKGQILPDFQLQSIEGTPVSLSDFRGRCNLVLIFVDHHPETMALISGLAEHEAELREENAQVLAIARSHSEADAAVARGISRKRVLIDPDGTAFARFGALDAAHHEAAAFYVADKFAEASAIYRTRDGHALPTVTDIVGWLTFINIQCPECEPPEWPL